MVLRFKEREEDIQLITMDPKVCGKLLTTHRRGYGVDVEALRGLFPLRRSAGEGSKKVTVVEIVFSWPWMFSRYVGIYRRKKYVGGRKRGPRDRGRALQGGLLSRGSLGCFLTCTPSPLDHARSKKSRSRRFHSLWTPFDIPFLRNTEIGKNTAIRVGPPVSRLVPKLI